MARDDIIDIDEVIDESLILPKQAPIADKIYSDDRAFGVDAAIKNFLVENTFISPGMIDFTVGPPRGARSRFFSPGRGFDPLGLPPGSPLQFRGFRELLEPTDPQTQMLREMGVQEDTPAQISRLASFLPADVYDSGVQRIVKRYYRDNFDIPLETDYDFQREPVGRQVVFRDPTSNELTFINPPGLDIGSFTAGAEPALAETAAAVVGLKTLGISGAFLAPIAAQFAWRYNNLNQLAKNGYLDKTYDKGKILGTAMRDAGMTALFQTGGATAFKLLKTIYGGKFIPGIDEDEFVTAYNALKSQAEETGVGKEILEKATVPEIMEAGSVGSPIVRRGLEAEIIDCASKGYKRAAQVAERLEEGARAKKEEIVESVVEEAGEGIPTKPDVGVELTRLEEEGVDVLRARDVGVKMREEFKENVDPRILEADRAIEEVRGGFDKQLRDLVEGSVEPEVALNVLRETVKDISKGDKSLPGLGKSFKIKLNKILSDNRTEQKILDDVLNLAKTSDREFFKNFLKDPEYAESVIVLRKALKNNYKQLLRKDEAGNYIPLSREAHNKFLQENKNIMDDIFEAEDLTSFKNAENLSRRLSRKEKEYEAAVNELQKEPWGSSDPERIFENTWTKEKGGITRTEKVFDVIGENQELADEYRLLILNDMKKQTNNFTEGIPKYLRDYSAMLDVWYPKQVTNNMKALGNLIEDMSLVPGAKGGEDLSVEIANKLFRVYFGFFTPTGRAISATKQFLSVFKNKRFVDALLDPEKYLKGVERRKAFFNNPYVLEFYRSGVRASARETEAVSGFDEPKEGIIPTTDPVFFEDEVSRTELKGGGEPLMELKYNL